MSSGSRALQIPVIVLDMRPRQDRSWRLTFETRELPGDDVKLLAESLQGEGWLLFKPNGGFVDEELPKGIAEPGTKSQSQRLRNVIFILWKQKGEKGDFETYYRTTLEKLIDYVKSMLIEED